MLAKLLVFVKWTRRILFAMLAIFGFGWLYYRSKHGDPPDVGTPNQDRVRAASERNDLDALKDEVLK